MRSHLKGQALSAELALGNVTQREVDANAEVDTLASNGAQAHSLTFEDVALQSETVSLAVRVHQMQLNLLTIRRQKSEDVDDPTTSLPPDDFPLPSDYSNDDLFIQEINMKRRRLTCLVTSTSMVTP